MKQLRRVGLSNHSCSGKTLFHAVHRECCGFRNIQNIIVIPEVITVSLLVENQVEIGLPSFSDHFSNLAFQTAPVCSDLIDLILATVSLRLVS